MLYTTTVTQKGQVTIPAEIRKRFGIMPYKKVTFVTISNQVVIKPAEDFLSLRGSIKSNKSFDDKKVNQSILDYKKKEYEEKLRSA